jgi:hypothetical protein
MSFLSLNRFNIILWCAIDEFSERIDTCGFWFSIDNKGKLVCRLTTLLFESATVDFYLNPHYLFEA